MNNKGVKICMIIILIIVAVILINVMLIGIVKKDSKNRLSFFAIGNHTEVLFDKEYDIRDIKNININTKSKNVKFQEGNSDKAKITIYGIQNDTFDVTLNENELAIKEENHNFYIFALFFWAREEIIIELPKSFEGDIRN